MTSVDALLNELLGNSDDQLQVNNKFHIIIQIKYKGYNY